MRSYFELDPLYLEDQMLWPWENDESQERIKFIRTYSSIGLHFDTLP